MKSTRNGFSLIEVLVAVAVLALLGLSTAGVVYSTFRAKTSAERDMEVIDIGRAVLRMMKRDISLAFHRPVYSTSTSDKGSSKSSLYDSTSESEERVKTVFTGRNSDPYDSITFTTFSHRRYYKNSRESSQTEISYYVEPDPVDENNMVLYRRESKRIDDKPLEGGRAYKFAEYITFIDFQYWDCVKGEYVDAWDSYESIDYRDKFPEAVRVVIGLDDFQGGEKIFRLVEHVKMPNNIKRRNMFSGSSDSGVGVLNPDCGNKKCEPEKGENKDSCPKDCKKETENKVDALLTKFPEGSCTQ